MARASTPRKDLLPGLYSIKVSAPSFLPALQEKIGLQPGTSVHVNITLNTLLNAIRVGPLRGTADDDGWKWTLRSVANRPVLRIFDDPATGAEQQDHDLKASLSFLAGSAAAGYGSGSDMSTGFSVERSIFSAVPRRAEWKCRLRRQPSGSRSARDLFAPSARWLRAFHGRYGASLRAFRSQPALCRAAGAGA